MVWHANARAAHAHNVFNIAEIALNAHARKHQRAFVIHIARQHEIAGGDGIADIRHVAFGDACEKMLAFIEDRHHESMVGRVCIATIGVVIQIGIATAYIPRMIAAHIGGLDMAAEDMYR